MDNYILSVIVPCYNCSKTIERLLDSIVAQKWDKNKFEVIIVDDKSTDDFYSKVEKYKDELNIKTAITSRDFHCPGNTRQAGLEIAKGEWITFIDNDDMFIEGSFDKIYNYIQENNVEYIVSTNFYAYDYEEKKITRKFEGEDADTWHHGKWYNNRNLIDKYNIHFKDDLFSHEDVFFNSLCLGHLKEDELDYNYAPIFSYLWIENKQSLSRSYFNEEYFYIETYLEDYIYATTDSYFEVCEKTEKQNVKDFCFHQIMMGLLHAYFYHQANVYRKGIAAKGENVLVIHNLVKKITDFFDVTPLKIIDYIYGMPDLYMKVKEGCFIGTNHFVEVNSFRDFILNI